MNVNILNNIRYLDINYVQMHYNYYFTQTFKPLKFPEIYLNRILTTSTKFQGQLF